VGGAYNVVEDEDLRMDVALAELERSEAPELETRSGALDELFDLQTEIVFSVIDRLGIELTAEERAAIETVPTRNLQAFLAYSRGLIAEDNGNFTQAARAFGQARRADPSFDQAAVAEQQVQQLGAAAGPVETALTAVRNIEPPPATLDLVTRRLRILTGTTGAGFVPDGDQRQPAAEGQVDLLPDPPPPPSRGNQ
jgi:hypothetical protein